MMEEFEKWAQDILTQLREINENQKRLLEIWDEPQAQPEDDEDPLSETASPQGACLPTLEQDKEMARLIRQVEPDRRYLPGAEQDRIAQEVDFVTHNKYALSQLWQIRLFGSYHGVDLLGGVEDGTIALQWTYDQVNKDWRNGRPKPNAPAFPEIVTWWKNLSQ